MLRLPLKCQLEHIPLVIRSFRTWIAFIPQDLDCLSPSGRGLPFSLRTWIAFLPQDLDCLSPSGLGLPFSLRTLTPWFPLCCINEILDINSCIWDEIRPLQTFQDKGLYSQFHSQSTISTATSLPGLLLAHFNQSCRPISTNLLVMLHSLVSWSSISTNLMLRGIH